MERLLDRAEDWHAYELPVAPSELKGTSALEEAPGWVRLTATRGATVSMVTLERQQGEADVIAVGQLRGITVVTRHRVERSEGVRELLVLHGGLGRPGPGVIVGAHLDSRAVVGTLPDTLGESGLDLSIRELRDPLAGPPSTLASLESEALGFTVDPRNALSLRP